MLLKCFPIKIGRKLLTQLQPMLEFYFNLTIAKNRNAIKKYLIAYGLFCKNPSCGTHIVSFEHDDFSLISNVI